MKYIMRKLVFAGIMLLILLVLFVSNLTNNGRALIDVFTSIRVTSIEDVRTIFTNLEDVMNETFTGRMSFVEAYSFSLKLFRKEEVSDFLYVKDEKDYLHNASFYIGPDSNMLRYALRIKTMQDKVTEKGGQLLFVIPPTKFKNGETELGYGLPAANPENTIAQLMMVLTEHDVNVIDFNSYFPNLNMSYEDCFYRTERYWTIPAAWMATREIVHWMEMKLGTSLDPGGEVLGPSSYNWVTYPQKMLGSQGLKSGRYYIGLEDFTALWPNEAGSYEYLSYLENGERNIIRGDIYSTLIDRSILTSNEESPTTSAYNAYLPGQYLHSIITNRDNIDGISVLMIRDSYLSPVACFMAPLVGKIDSIWANYEETYYNVEEYIEANNFDFVIFEIDPYNISLEAFDFYEKEVDEIIERMEAEQAAKDEEEGVIRPWRNTLQTLNQNSFGSF